MRIRLVTKSRESHQITPGYDDDVHKLHIRKFPLELPICDVKNIIEHRVQSPYKWLLEAGRCYV